MTRMRTILRNQAGYTLAELLVCFAVVGFLLAALLQVQQISLRNFLHAEAVVEAQAGSRSALDRVVGELTLIGAYYAGATGAGNAITAANATTLTFVGDVDGDTLDTAGAEVRLQVAAAVGAVALVVDRTTGLSGGSAFAVGEWVTLLNGSFVESRQITAVAGTTLTIGTPLANAFGVGTVVRSAEVVTYSLTGGNLTRSVNGGAAETLAGNVTGMTFTYFDGAGAQLAAAPPVASVREVSLSVTSMVAGKPGRLMTARIRPRSLNL